MELKHAPPRDAVRRYLNKKETHVSDKTLHNYSTALRRFNEYLDTRDIDNLNNIDSDEIQRFAEWRLESVKPITARNDMRTIKNFIEFCETIQAVPVGLHKLVSPPRVDEDDEICDVYLTREEAVQILDHFNKYEYASTRHITILILWKTGMRLGGLRALDTTDLDEANSTLNLRHRPDTGTPLKRKSKSERNVVITQETAGTIQDYIDTPRPDTIDKYGRRPLMASREGRMVATTLQKNVYTATRPCSYNGGKCPHDRNTETCEALAFDQANKCPSSVSPHALRRGYVTAAQDAEQPKEVTSERVNMSGKILDKHYDKGGHDDKAERRRDHIKDI